ncbi:hypothetical protein FB45DRAFT_1052348 [Roridomyces roridus]|uniref:F-box domain-containing protein n=1 Tax=Roridomyces roridus TaxID=1738132 RepID=A0AAD7FX83_9AGAR|nr:hypothetical protein FB45DRAFT_1052348 [Roridomyces roridus]
MGSFEWTSPTRRIGRRELSPIPNEVYLEIFSYFEPTEAGSREDCKKVLSNLALVCRFFGAFAISHIYHTVVFSGHDRSPGLVPFCRGLVNDDSGPSSRLSRDVAEFVREVVFKDWIGRDEGVWGAFLSLYLNAVRKLPSVESIHLESTPISKTLILAVTKSFKKIPLPDKDSSTGGALSIRSCAIHADISAKEERQLNSLRLSHLEYISCSGDLPPKIMFLQNVETFRTDSWPFSDHFLRKKHPDLRVLELHNVESTCDSVLFKFLSQSPSITDLIIHCISINPQFPIPADALRPNSLPKLTTLTIPPTLLKHFGRPTLRTVSLSGREMRQWNGDVYHNPVLPLFTAKELAPLLLARSTLTELNIHDHMYSALPEFHKRFPQLRVLLLDYTHVNFSSSEGPPLYTAESFRAEVERIGARWGAAPAPLQLCEFRIHIGSGSVIEMHPFLWDLPFQRSLIVSALATPSRAPLLTRVSFAKWIVWERWDAHTEGAGSWRPWVPCEMREFVKTKLEKGAMIVDVRPGGLAGLD